MVAEFYLSMVHIDFKFFCIITTWILCIPVPIISLSPRTTMVLQLIPLTPQPSWPSKCWEAGSPTYWWPVMFASVHIHVMDIVVRTEESSECTCIKAMKWKKGWRIFWVCELETLKLIHLIQEFYQLLHYTHVAFIDLCGLFCRYSTWRWKHR